MTALACNVDHKHLALVPRIGIAVPGPYTSDTIEGSVESEGCVGRAYTFLPLPVQTGLPFHVNAHFEISNNRRDLWSGQDMTGDGRKRTECG